MILRFRLPDGSTKRVEAKESDTLADLLRPFESEWADLRVFRDYKDASTLDTSATIGSHGISHGDMLILGGSSKSAPANGNASELSEEEMPSTSERAQTNVRTSNKESGSNSKKGRCLHGPHGMCEHCMPKEDPKERYNRALEQLRGLRGGSIAALEAAEAMKFHIKAQEESTVNSVSVDRDAAFAFQANLVQIGFQQQRLGFLYGHVEESNLVYIDCIYEPPQKGTFHLYKLSSEEESEALESQKQSEKLASLLGLQKVGWIFSSKPRKCIFSGVDILTACEFQCDVEREFGEEAAKTFVTITVSSTEEGMIHLEAYQVSELCIDMYKAGVFLPKNEQKPNSGKVRTKEDVIVEGVECRAVDTDFFLVAVPIKDHHSWLKNNCKTPNFLRVFFLTVFYKDFPVENREQAPQKPADLAKCLSQSRDEPFIRRITDFHMLLYISNVLDINADMPILCNAVREQRDLVEEEEGYQLMIEAIANAAS
eukprot:jgi/Galph1/4528/GphlegSOOS_G3174.1